LRRKQTVLEDELENAGTIFLVHEKCFYTEQVSLMNLI
jgi:hypothetical protein